MPQIRSMKKRLRQSLKRRDRNRQMKVKVKATRRTLLDNLSTATAEESLARLTEAQKALDKAAKRGVLHANAAARRKAKLATRVAALQAQ
jgi:small subunit ribosomal protein S20